MSDQKWKVGDLAYVSGDYIRLGGGVFTVAKVGRKWITIAGRQGRQFDIITGQENSDGVGGYCYARTSEEHAVWSERCTLLNALSAHRWINAYHLHDWPAERLRKLLALAEEATPPTTKEGA